MPERRTVKTSKRPGSPERRTNELRIIHSRQPSTKKRPQPEAKKSIAKGKRQFIRHLADRDQLAIKVHHTQGSPKKHGIGGGRSGKVITTQSSEARMKPRTLGVAARNARQSEYYPAQTSKHARKKCVELQVDTGFTAVPVVRTPSKYERKALSPTATGSPKHRRVVKNYGESRRD